LDRQKRKDLIEIFNILEEAIDHVDNLMSSNTDAIFSLLSQCQESAVVIGNTIEEFCGQGTDSVTALERFCEDAYNFSEKLSKNTPISDAGMLKKSLEDARHIFSSEFPMIKEIVFLPCSPDYWDGFDYIYRKLSKDNNNNLRVIPIPWYDRLPNGNLDGSNPHFDIDGYPKDITLIAFDKYDFEGIHPDIVYIQNAFDNQNLGASISPLFYTDYLHGVTDELIYVPHFVLTEPEIKSNDQIEKLREYLTVPGINYIDKIILQSENMKLAMIKMLAGDDREQYKASLEKKITCEDFPRVMEVKECQSAEIPAAWEKYILKQDGSRKKVILYSNSVSALLSENTKLITKIKSTFQIFKDNNNDVALIWRPHPLLSEVIAQLRPEFADSYSSLIEAYKSDAIGILDESDSPLTAISVCDAFYGDKGSVLELFKATGKPIMVENVDVL
jgi:hypothetical protein